MKKRFLRLYVCILIVPILLLNLTSCEVEMEYYEASYLVSSANAEAYKADAVTEEDVENISVDVTSFDGGTSARAYKNIFLEITPVNFFGYQFLYCDFIITPSADVELTLEHFSQIGSDGEIQSQGMTSYSLTSGERTEISLPIALDFTEEIPDYVALEIVFSSTLPLSEESTDGEQGTDEDNLTFAEWSSITYEISEMLFYGAQTTAT